jgi:hypothetical protein
MRGGAPAQTFASIRPFASKATIIIHHAHMGALAAHAELSRRTDRKGDGRIAARGVTAFGIPELQHPNVALPHDVVSAVGHALLLQTCTRPKARV